MSLGNLQSVRSHKDDFDRQYEHLANRDTRHLNFPLEETEKLEWGRGPYGNQIYSYFYRRFTAYIIGLLQVADGHRILNIGCGTDLDAKNLMNLYRELDLYSIDISHNMILAAKRNNSPSKLSLAIAEQLPFPDQAFDRIFSREVIEHVISPTMMLREIERCLKPGGVAVITTEFESSLAPSHLYSTFRSRILAPLFKVKLSNPPYKDEAPAVEEFRSLAAHCGLMLERVIWDGCMYLFCGSLVFQRFFKCRIASVARFFSVLECQGSVDRFFCDQVKFVVRKPEGSKARGQKTSPMPDLVKKTEVKHVIEHRGGRVRTSLFNYADRVMSFAYNLVVPSLAVVLVLYRTALGKHRLFEKLTFDDRIAKYLANHTIA